MSAIRQAYHALETTLCRFMPQQQRIVLVAQLGGLEGAGIAEIVNNIAKVIADMPKSYETDGQGQAAVARLHYFQGGVEAWITEKDAGNPDKGDVSQRQAFGLVTLTGNVEDGELGYVSIEELISCNVELDLHWTPKTLEQIQAGQA